MSTFVELTLLKENPDTGQRLEVKTLINTHDIVGASPSEDMPGTIVQLRGMKDGGYVTETYEEVKDLLAPNVFSQDIGNF